MAKKINGSEPNRGLPSHVELEFLEALLGPEDATYPWNPADEQTDAYFLELEQQFQGQDVLDEELTTRSHTFYSQLDTLWSNLATSSYYKCSSNSSALVNLQKTLQASFATYVPQEWILGITHKAAEIFNSQQSFGEQLVQCVQTVLPTWGADDLNVLVRPFAYAMRSGTQYVESVLENFGDRDWTALSEIEQAKVSLAIASYTLNQLQNFQEEC